MSTWILRLDAPAGATGPRVAVKDLIDVAGTPTTGANPTVAAAAAPAEVDAACLAGLRAAGAVIVGQTTLHELAVGGTGINPWYGPTEHPRSEERRAWNEGVISCKSRGYRYHSQKQQ